MMATNPRDPSEWSTPWRVVHKVYRTVVETPRRRGLRERVLSLSPAPPIVADAECDYSVHMLVCSRDVEMAAVTAKVADLAFGTSLPWTFHDDGSLRDEDERLLAEQLPGSRVIRRPEADGFARKELASHSEILEYRDHQVMALKLVDVKLWSRGRRFAYIDSDVLFFREPTFMIEALNLEREKNYFNKDLADGYVQPASQIEEAVGIRPASRINAGLWVLHTSMIDLDRIEAWLKHPAFRDNLYDYTLDQTFIAMLAAVSENGVEHLPDAYDVDLRKPLNGAVEKHYVGRIRHGYELEGLHHLLTNLDLERRWEAFTPRKTIVG